MLHARSVEEVADEKPERVDPVGIGGGGPGKVHPKKAAGLIEEAMAISGGIGEAAHKVSQQIQSKNN